MKYSPKHIFYVARVWYEYLTLSPLSHHPKANTHTGSIEKWRVQARFCCKTSVVWETSVFWSLQQLVTNSLTEVQDITAAVIGSTQEAKTISISIQNECFPGAFSDLPRSPPLLSLRTDTCDLGFYGCPSSVSHVSPRNVAQWKEGGGIRLFPSWLEKNFWKPELTLAS